MILVNNKITVLPLEKRHLEWLRQLRNHPETSIYLTSVIPINQYAQEEWFRKISLDPEKMYFAIENKKGKFIGMVRADEWDKINRSIRIGVDILPQERRKGYAYQTYLLLLDYLFHHLGINRVWFLVAQYNTPGILLYKKLGFIEEGKQRKALFRHNKFHDYLMLSMLKEEYEKRYPV